ncbi:MAG: ABC transporter permease [Clostridia bacterium]|nr:ABC transporter permease [Clostridia bacterium]MBQ8356554.1 ABC transporter permease [Clostridia bacterium]
MESTVKFEHKSFGQKLKTMLAVDCRRMRQSPIFYILVGAAFLIPVLILVMTTMMEGTVSTDPTTGVETVMEGFTSVWQSIGSVGGESSGMSMDLVSMCNINMMYFLAAVFVCTFVADDFRSGYAKNLFTVRAGKVDYVVSKTVVGFIGGAVMLIAYFAGAMLGGAIAGLPFDLGTLTVGNIVMCMLAKVFLMLVFVAIFVLVSVATKQRLWASIVGSLGASMLLFTMIPMITPLNATIMNVILCLVGGGLFGIGLGAVSNLVLGKTSLV